jgi:hypothetical protein
MCNAMFFAHFWCISAASHNEEHKICNINQSHHLNHHQSMHANHIGGNYILAVVAYLLYVKHF